MARKGLHHFSWAEAPALEPLLGAIQDRENVDGMICFKGVRRSHWVPERPISLLECHGRLSGLQGRRNHDGTPHRRGVLLCQVPEPETPSRFDLTLMGSSRHIDRALHGAPSSFRRARFHCR